MKKFLSTLHRWFGFPLGLLFVITFGTGFLTSIDELLQRLEQFSGSAVYTYHPTSIEEKARTLSAITVGKKGIRSVRLPTQEAPYYQLIGRGERWVYAIGELEPSEHITRNSDEFFHTVLQLHRNLLLGKEGLFGIGGKDYVAWEGLLALALSLLGLWLWWPLRKSFKVKDVIPRGKKRKHFYYSHMTSGVIVLALILLMGLTGASITYRSITQQLMGIDKNAAPNPLNIEVGKGWLSWLSTAYVKMPAEAELIQIRYPRQAKGGSRKPNLRAERGFDGRNKNQQPQKKQQRQNDKASPDRNKLKELKEPQSQGRAAQKSGSTALLEFRFLTPDDWLGLGNSHVQIDKQSSHLVNVSFFKDRPFAEKVFSILKPLHTGHNLAAYYTVFLLIMSIIGTLMVLSGLISFVIKKRKYKVLKGLLNTPWFITVGKLFKF